MIDHDKAKECRKSLGYHQIVTSELTMETRKVIDKDHGLTQIKDQFRVIKWNLLPEDLYRFMDADDPNLKLILDSFSIRIPTKLYRRAELKHIKTEINGFKRGRLGSPVFHPPSPDFSGSDKIRLFFSPDVL